MDTDKFPTLAERFAVGGLPTFVVFKVAGWPLGLETSLFCVCVCVFFLFLKIKINMHLAGPRVAGVCEGGVSECRLQEEASNEQHPQLTDFPSCVFFLGRRGSGAGRGRDGQGPAPEEHQQVHLRDGL